MKKMIRAIGLLAVVAMCGCNSSKVEVSGRLVGLGSESVYLEQVSGGNGKIIDSVRLDNDGYYRFEIEDVGAAPSLYNIVYNGERAPLLLSDGDHVTLNSMGSLLRNYTVSGSEESELLREFNKEFIAGVERMTSILEQFSDENADSAENQALVQEYMDAYRAAKRAQLKFIIEHKDRIAAIYALYQRFPGETSLSNNPDGDMIYYREVADAVEGRYPESSFLPTLRTEVAKMDARRNLLTQISEVNYPDVVLTDMYGNEIKLSSLDGKVILLSFWSPAQTDANMLNAELKEVYKRYADKGFEIYQVAVETSKALWINSVQEQRLPWISVCDFRGVAPSLYNVRTLPSDFLIDARGNIVGRDLYGDDLAKALTRLLE